MARLSWVSGNLPAGEKPGALDEKPGALGKKPGVPAVEKSNYKKSRVHTTRLFCDQLCELFREGSLSVS